MNINSDYIIHCKNQYQVENCLEDLKCLGFLTKFNKEWFHLYIVYTIENGFTNVEKVELDDSKKLITYDEFLSTNPFNKNKLKKLLNSIIQTGVITDNNKRVIAINNLSHDTFYIFIMAGLLINLMLNLKTLVEHYVMTKLILVVIIIVLKKLVLNLFLGWKLKINYNSYHIY